MAGRPMRRFFFGHSIGRPREPSSSISRPSAASQEPAAHEDCERRRTIGSTLKTRESSIIERDVRLGTSENVLETDSNSAFAKSQCLKTWGENVNGATTGAAQERQNCTDETRVSSADRYSRVNIAAASRPYTNSSASASGDQESTSTPARCAASPRHAGVADEQVFAPYQPPHGKPYDLTNPFDRTNMSIVIRKGIGKCERYLESIGSLRRGGELDADEFLQRSNETIATLRRHRHALARLYDISGGNL